MNEEYLYPDKKPDGNDSEMPSGQSSVPESGTMERVSEHTAMPGGSDTEPASGNAAAPKSSADETASGNAAAPYGSRDVNEQVSQEPKPEVSWNEPQPGLYREGTFQSRGEYHQAPPQGMQQGSYQQSFYQSEPPSGYSSAPYSIKEESQGFGIASLVMGIVSLVLFCTCINLPVAVIAIIFGILQLSKEGSRKGAAIAGIITSALSILIFFIFLIAMLTSTDFKKGFERGFENGLEDFYYNYDMPDYYDDHHDDTF